MTHSRKLAAGALVAVALVASACGSGRTDKGDTASGGSLVVGTTDRVSSLDPAGSYDQGSFTVMNQVFPFLMNFKPGDKGELTPDIASSCSFSSPTVYSCTIKDGVKFANGDPLTSASAKFSFDRILKINDPNGPASLLTNLASVDAPDPKTVNFTLKSANDQTFPQVLATNAGPIVDEKVFPADRIATDDEIVSAKGMAGPYTIRSNNKNVLTEFARNDDYQGSLGASKAATVSLKYYNSSDNLKLDIQNGAIDVAWRSLTPTDIEGLRSNNTLAVHEGSGGELRYLVFNLNTMPGGNDAQKLAVRKAVASSIDRQALATGVYKDTYAPAYSFVPQGVDGATTPFKDIYGTNADKAKAAGFLSAAGVTTPVAINLQYNTDHYGSSSSEEYAAIKSQLESTGLFTVNLQSTEWTTYSKERVKDSYPVYQLGWFPDFPDADNYITPFFAPNNFLQSHFEVPAITSLINAETTEPDKTKRLAIIGQIQQQIAQDYVPTIPLLTGKQIAVSKSSVQGLDSTLDAAFKLRFTALSKG